MTMNDLSEKEKILLLAVWRLKTTAYGVHIRKEIEARTGSTWNYGSLYRMLDQLVKKEMLERGEGEPIPESGGRRKIFYTLSEEGFHSLEKAYRQQRVLWEGAEEILIEGESGK